VKVPHSLAVLFLGAGLVTANAAQVIAVAIHDWPNERFSNEVPSRAIDGDTSTFTWSSESFTTAEQSLGLDFGQSVYLDQIRLWKLPDGGGGPNIKNLFIEYTNSSVGLGLSSRSWTAVADMVNGHNGVELLSATSVNSDGSVIGDVHDSNASGWASLSFDPVFATGVRIRFSTQSGGFNHYRVGEFEAFDTATPEPSTISLAIGALGLLVGRRLRRR
jgi:hypothetical protein